MKKLLLLIALIPGMILAEEPTYGRNYETLTFVAHSYRHGAYISTTIKIDGNYIIIGGDGTCDNKFICFEAIETPRQSINASGHHQIAFQAIYLEKNKIV